MIAIESPAVERESQKAKSAQKSRRRGLIFAVIVGSIVVHLVALALFGLWILQRYYEQPEATFQVVPREVRIPPQTKEHRMNLARHQAMAPKPVFQKRLLNAQPRDFALPDMPEVDLDQMLPLDPNELISEQVTSLVGGTGLGSGSAQGGGGPERPQIESLGFFGIEDEGGSVVIMIDISSSMFGRTGDLDYSTGRLVRRGKEQSFQKVRDEAIKLVQGLSITSSFGIIRWSGSARSWQETLVPATDQNKEAAAAHIQEEVDSGKAGPMGGRLGGTRHDYALEKLLELQPAVAFMLSDGNATESLPGGGFQTIEADRLYRILDEAKRAERPIPKIHTIYYLTGADKREEERMLRGIARRTGGQFRKVEAEGRRDD
ncbi:MAG: vWA domain-containing protein [Verrucomicrobiota bacterium]